MHYMALCIVYLFMCLVVTPASPATIERASEDSNDGCSLYLNGDIEEGDSNKLSAELDKDGAYALCLSSEGGNFNESFRITEVVLSYLVATRILPGKRCLSACAIVFMSGTSKRTGGDYINRSMSVSSILGFHAPKPQVGGPSRIDWEDVQQAHIAAVKSIGKGLLGLARHRDRSWPNPLIKPTLISEMLVTYGADNYYYIDTVRKVAEFKIDVYDARPPVTLGFSEYRNLCANGMAQFNDSVIADLQIFTGVDKITTTETKDNKIVTTVIPNFRTYCRIIREKSEPTIVQSTDETEEVTIKFDIRGGENTVEEIPLWYAYPAHGRIEHLSKRQGDVLKSLARPVWCAKPASDTEETICRHPELVQADAELNILYAEALAKFVGGDRHRIRQTQGAWLVKRNNCRGEYICVDSAYMQRNDFLSVANRYGLPEDN